MDRQPADVRQDVIESVALETPTLSAEDRWFPNDQSFVGLVSAVYCQAVLECFGRNLELRQDAKQWLLSGDAELYASVAGIDHEAILPYVNGKKRLRQWQKDLIRKRWTRKEKGKDDDGN